MQYCDIGPLIRVAAITLGALFLAPAGVFAHHTDSHFEDSAAHKLVYQLNKADPEYQRHILFSAGEMLRKYGDDIEIVIVAFGPGIHLLAKQPRRAVAPDAQERTASLAQYGVSFHACGNTMKTLGWTQADMVGFSKVVPIGADDLMQLQEQGFSYISW